MANIVTTAVKSDDGQHYIINGTKKWYDSRFIYIKTAGLIDT